VSSLAVLVTDLPAADAARQLEAMVRTMMHEPFYAAGSALFPEHQLYCGWVDHCNDRSRPVALHEHDNKAVLLVGEESGWTGGERSSQEAAHSLLGAYAAGSDRWLRELNGWFAGVLIDRQRSEILVFNDRYGMHRVYHAPVAGGYAFASEAKALLSIRDESRAFDTAGLGEYLASGCVFSGRTLFRDVQRLPAASLWKLKADGTIDAGRYFQPEEWEQQAPLQRDAFYNELAETLRAVTPKYFVAAEPVALSLTGGLDSRVALAYAGRPAAPHLAYTYNGAYQECFDVKVARRVAAVAGWRHEVLGLDRDFLGKLPEDAERAVWVTDGTADVTIAHELHLSARARQHARIRVTGNYGGEIFRGVSTFRPLELGSELFAGELRRHVDEASQSLAERRRRHPVTFAMFDEIPSSLYGRLAAAQSQLAVRTPYTDNALVSLAYRRPDADTTPAEGWRRLLQGVNASLAAIETDRARLGSNPSAFGRLQRLARYASFKAEWYYDGGMPAWLASFDRRLFASAPPAFVGSHKIQHYRRWFQHECAEAMTSWLEGVRSQPWVNRRACERLLAAHRSGRGTRVTELAMLATLQIVHERFLRAGSIQAAVRHTAPIAGLTESDAPGRRIAASRI
jgi:asparagine synthase (glutamine-hydrolysing)